MTGRSYAESLTPKIALLAHLATRDATDAMDAIDAIDATDAIDAIDYEGVPLRRPRLLATSQRVDQDDL